MSKIVLLVFIIFTVSCKKKPYEQQPPLPQATISTYTVTGKILSYQCGGALNAYVYFDYDFMHTTKKVLIQSGGSFTFTYSTGSFTNALSPYCLTTNYKGQPILKFLDTISCNQNGDLGSYAFNPTTTFYVHFKSSTQVTGYVSLNSETYYGPYLN